MKSTVQSIVLVAVLSAISLYLVYSHFAQMTGIQKSVEFLSVEIQNLRHQTNSKQHKTEIFLKILALRPKISLDLARTVTHAVYKHCSDFGKDPELVISMIEIESNGWDPNSVSPVGAEGLMQVMPHWKKRLNISGDLRDPDINIYAGVVVLGIYEAMFKNLPDALTAYNRGAGPVDKADMRGSSPDNGYADKVLDVYNRLKNMNVEDKAGAFGALAKSL